MCISTSGAVLQHPWKFSLRKTVLCRIWKVVGLILAAFDDIRSFKIQLFEEPSLTLTNTLSFPIGFFTGKTFLHTSKCKRCQNDWWEAPGVSVTWVQLSVATSQQVAELVTLFTLAVTCRGVEAQLLHQHQRLLTQVFIPVPRHPPICIALSPEV